MSLPFEDFTGQPPQELITQGASGTDITVSGVPFWGDAPKSWETVKIAGLTLPGICTLDGKVKRRHDKKHTAGVNGAVLTYLGDDQAEFTITVRMWTPEHLQTYAQVLATIREQTLTSSDDFSSQKPGAALVAFSNTQAARKDAIAKRPFSKFPIVPLDVVHPVLTLHKIKAAHVLEYGFPKPKGEPSTGIYESTIQFIEYVPGSKGTVVTPPGAAASTRKTAFDDKIGRTPSAANKVTP